MYYQFQTSEGTIDCYGKLDGSNNVEVITDVDSWIVDASGFRSWERLCAHLSKHFINIQEVVAD